MENYLLQTGVRIINRYNTINKKARYYGTDTLLYPSEIHVIDTIGYKKDMTTTKLSECLGITKGGISQIISKLEKKGLIEKKSGDGINEVYISLNDKGALAFEGHRQLHKKMTDRMNQLFNEMDDFTRNKINEIVGIIDQEITRLEDEK